MINEKQQLQITEKEPLVFSLGGSLVVPPEGIDIEFLSRFRKFIDEVTSRGRKVVVVVGGGGTARKYQDAARQVAPLTRDDLDWLGIHSTRLNGHLLRTVLREISNPIMFKNPTRIPKEWPEPVIVAAGWKPGWSTDYVAVRAARRLGGRLVLNLSNVDQLFTTDPKLDPTAAPISSTTWPNFCKMVGTEWDPGMNVPFDPVASKFARKNHMTVLLMGGKDLDNVEACIKGKSFVGTTIRPDKS